MYEQEVSHSRSLKAAAPIRGIIYSNQGDVFGRHRPVQEVQRLGLERV